MAHVVLTPALARFTGGQTDFDLDVGSINQLIRALAKMHPEIKPHLEEGVAVAIDGQIYQDALLTKIEPDSEVHILPQIGGG